MTIGEGITVEALLALVDRCSDLAASVSRLCEQVCKLVEDSVDRLTSFQNDKIEYDYKARAAIDEVRDTAREGSNFLAKVEDLQYYARKMNQATRSGDKRQLKELFQLVRNCVANAEEQYAIFDEACKKSTETCMGAAKKCRQENGREKYLYPVLGAIGGGALVGVGVYTFGIGTLVGFLLITAGAAVGGYLTHHLMTKEDSHKSFIDLAATFDEMYDTTKKIREEVNRVSAEMKRVEDSVRDFEFSEGKNHSAETLSYITDRMEEKLRDSETTLSRERLKKML